MYYIIFVSALLLISCSSPAPKPKLSGSDQADICRYANLSNPTTAEMCGIDTRTRKSVSPPKQRFLKVPKGTSMVLWDEELELRISNTQPIILPFDLAKNFNFSENASTDLIQNKYEYKEIYPSPRKRVRVFKLTIPTKIDTIEELCFEIPQRVIDRRQKRTVGNKVNKIKCSEYEKLLKVSRF
jgi:hypothetical protein